MSGTYSMTVGNKGRVVLPAALRESKNWGEGSVLIARETERGILLTSRDELKEIVRAQLSGSDLVGDLLRERREAAAREDAE